MFASLDPTVVLVLIVAVAIAGAVNGIAGFGFSVVGTMALATAIDPAVAIVFMILPILAVNISLVGELNQSQLRACGTRFGPFIFAVLIGTVIGMSVLQGIPEAPLQLVLGTIALGYVAGAQSMISLPGGGRFDAERTRNSLPLSIGIGSLSGVIFGGTNVGVQIVAYVRSYPLSHSVFVGVIALIFVGVNGIRVVIAGVFGYYPNIGLLGVSILASIPALVGVAIGKRIRPRLRPTVREGLVLGLLIVIGTRLLLSGIGL